MYISEEAKKMIIERGLVVTIDFAGIGGCCVPIYIPIAELRQPEEPDHYCRVDVEGISVFYPLGSITDQDGLRITLVDTGYDTRLEITGLYSENDSSINLAGRRE